MTRSPMRRSLKRTFLLVLALALPLSASAEWVSVASTRANVRDEPGMNGSTLWKAFIYTPFQVIERYGNWVHLRDYEGDEGWVHKNLLKADPCVVVKARYANIREGPGTSFKVSWQVDRGYPFALMDRQGDWLRIQDDGAIEGWIHKNLVWGDLSELSYGEEELGDAGSS